MKIFYKRNRLTYDGEEYSVDILKRVENKCTCLDRINNRIDTSDHDNEDEDYNNIRLHLYLIEPTIEVETNYDWEENPIYDYYEGEKLIPINFCPICGDKIELIMEEEIDKTEELKPLLKELNKIEKSRDSKERRRRRFEIITKIQRTMLDDKDF